MRINNKLRIKVTTIVFMSFIFAGNVTANAALERYIDYTDRSFDKLGRGLHDVVFCLGEIPYQMGQKRREHGVYGAMTSGFFSGIHHTALRAVVGIYEIATFYIPQEPILDPEFFFSGHREPKFPL